MNRRPSKPLWPSTGLLVGTHREKLPAETNWNDLQGRIQRGQSQGACHHKASQTKTGPDLMQAECPERTEEGKVPQPRHIKEAMAGRLQALEGEWGSECIEGGEEAFQTRAMG